jgi:hypothetical protein
MNYPERIQGTTTGWLYRKLYSCANGAWYKLEDVSWHTEIFFCDDNFKEETRKGRTTPAVVVEVK